VRAPENEAVAGGLDLVRSDEARDALGEDGLGRRSLPVRPEHASHSAEQSRALDRVVDVGECALEHFERLGKRE